MATAPLSFVCSGYSQNCKQNVLTPPSGKQINLYSAKCLNQSGGAIDVGIGKKLALSNWKFYKYTVANTPYVTDYTAAIQGGGALNIFDTTIGDGYLVGANSQFNVIGMTVGTGQTGTPVYLYQYYNGSSWVTLTTQAVPSTYASGDNLVVFMAPQDWVPGTPNAIQTGADTSKYYILVTATTAPGVAVTANAAWVVEFIDFISQLANNTIFETKVMDSVLPIIFSGTEGVIPYFSGTANAKNSMRVLYSIQG